MVYNRIVTLKDAWARKKRKAEPRRPTKSAPAAAPSEKRDHRAELEGDPVALSRFDSETARGLSAAYAFMIAGDPALAGFYDAAVEACGNPGAAASLILGDLRGLAKGRGLSEIPFGGSSVGQLAALVDSGRLSAKLAKKVLKEMLSSGDAPADIAERNGWRQISGRDELRSVLEGVLADNPAEAQRCRDGDRKPYGFLVGQAMRATGGQANPKMVNALLNEMLSS